MPICSRRLHSEVTYVVLCLNENVLNIDSNVALYVLQVALIIGINNRFFLFCSESMYVHYIQLNERRTKIVNAKLGYSIYIILKKVESGMYNIQ